MSNRTSLFYRRAVGGKVAIEDMVACTGARLFVHSGTGTDASGYGFSPDTPLATLDYAVGLCTASKGDIIVLMPGHAESKSVTGNIALLDIAGVQVIGQGDGSLIPTFTLGHATATMSVSAANCRIKHIKIISDIADCAVGLTAAATADGLIVEDCIFTDGALAKELVIGISIAAACDNVIIRDNYFYTTISAETGGCASAIKLVGESAGSKILGNFALGHYTVACIDAGTAASNAVLIRDNVMANIDTDAGLAYKGHASSINVLAYNVFAGSKNNTEPVSTVTASYCGENYGVDAAAANALYSPAQGAFS